MRAAGVMPRGTPGSATIAYTTSLHLHGQVLIFFLGLLLVLFFIGGRALSGAWAVVVTRQALFVLRCENCITHRVGTSAGRVASR